MKKLTMLCMVYLLIGQGLEPDRSRESVYNIAVAGMRLHYVEFTDQVASKGVFVQALQAAEGSRCSNSLCQ